MQYAHCTLYRTLCYCDLYTYIYVNARYIRSLCEPIVEYIFHVDRDGDRERDSMRMYGIFNNNNNKTSKRRRNNDYYCKFFFFFFCYDLTKGTVNVEQLKMAHNEVTIHLNGKEKNEICSEKLYEATQ